MRGLSMRYAQTIPVAGVEGVYISDVVSDYPCMTYVEDQQDDW